MTAFRTTVYTGPSPVTDSTPLAALDFYWDPPPQPAGTIVSVLDRDGRLIGDARAQDDGTWRWTVPHKHRWVSAPELGEVVELQLCQGVGCNEQRRVTREDS